MSEERPDGPSKETLRALAGQLPSYVAERKLKMAHADHIEKATRYRKYCMVCMKGFDKAETPIEFPAEKGICKDCAKMLKDHFAAVYNFKYAFLKPVDVKNQDLIGKIIPVTEPTFKKIEEEHETFTQHENPEKN